MAFIADMVQEKKQLVEKAEAILNEAEKTGGSLTKEQEREFDRYTDKIKKINDEIDEELLKIRTSEPILNTPHKPMACVNEVRTPVATKAVSKSFRGMFYGNEAVSLSNSGFHYMDEFLKTLHLGRADQRLLNSSMVEGIPGFGGYSVPEEYGAFLMDKSLESEIIRPRATVWGMGSETKKVPAFDGADRSTDLFGGISGEWLEEGQTGTRKVAKLRLIQLTAKKLACFSQASNELIADGMSFEEMLAGALIKGIGWYMDYAFINGTGEGQPLGILNDPALIIVSKETSQTTGTINYTNVVNMFSREKEIALDRSNVPGWMEDMTDYRVIVRVDGQGTWDKPVTPKNGTTLSWAVALEAR